MTFIFNRCTQATASYSSPRCRARPPRSAIACPEQEGCQRRACCLLLSGSAFCGLRLKSTPVARVSEPCCQACSTGNEEPHWESCSRLLCDNHHLGLIVLHLLHDIGLIIICDRITVRKVLGAFGNCPCGDRS